MATAKANYEEFRKRLERANILNQVKFELIEDHQNDDEDYVRYRIEILTKPYSQANCYIVMGLIAHFCNRLWAKNWQYMYIMQSHHDIVFTNGDDEVMYLIVDTDDGEIYKKADLVNCRKWILNRFDEQKEMGGYRLMTEEQYKWKFPTTEP